MLGNTGEPCQLHEMKQHVLRPGLGWARAIQCHQAEPGTGKPQQPPKVQSQVPNSLFSQQYKLTQKEDSILSIKQKGAPSFPLSSRRAWPLRTLAESLQKDTYPGSKTPGVRQVGPEQD